MAHEQGTATGYLDLYDKLVTFLTTNTDLVTAGQEWSVMRNRTNQDSEKELILKGQGLNGNDEIFVGIKTNSGSSGGETYHNFLLQGFSGYDADRDFETQPKAIQNGNSPVMHLWNQSIPYHFIANGRRFIVYARVSTVDQLMYQGLLLVGDGSPSQIPNPDDFKNLICVGGCSYDADGRFSNQGESYNMFWNSGTSVNDRYSSCYLNFNGQWRSFYNKRSSTSYSIDNITTPYGLPQWDTTRENTDDSLPLQRISFLSKKTAFNNFEGNFIGYLDGVQSVSGSSLSSGSTVTLDPSFGDDAGTWLIVQNVYRTVSSEYCCIHLA